MEPTDKEVSTQHTTELPKPCLDAGTMHMIWIHEHCKETWSILE